MEKKHWFKDIVKLIIVTMQLYLESSNKLHSIELFIKRMTKHITLAIIIFIPLFLALWGSLCIALYLYLLTKLSIANFMIVLIIALINLILILFLFIWFRSRLKDYELAKTSGVNFVLMKLLRSIRSLDRDSE